MVGETHAPYRTQSNDYDVSRGDLGEPRRSGRENLPLQAGEHPVIGDDIYNYSDFLLRHLGSPLLKVRKRKGDPEFLPAKAEFP